MANARKNIGIWKRKKKKKHWMLDEVKKTIAIISLTEGMPGSVLNPLRGSIPM